MKFYLILGLLAAFFFSGCAAPSYFHSDQEHKILSGIWLQNSAEYRGLAYQTFNQALLALKRAKKSSRRRRSRKRMAILMKIDGVVLEHSGYYATLVHRRLDESDVRNDPSLFNEWLKSPQLELVPGSMQFISDVHRLGVKVLFISERPVKQIGKIHRALKKRFINVGREHFYFKSTDKGVQQRRRYLGRKYDLVLTISDSAHMFHDKYSRGKFSDKKVLADEDHFKYGEDYFLIPNPFYGTWMNAMYGSKRHNAVHRGKSRLNYFYYSDL